MTDKKILVVDDDRTVIHLMSSLLEGIGQLRFATTGKEGLRLALRWVPDVVLLDLELPDIHGFEVCRGLKSNPALADVPVIILTGHDELEHEVGGLTAGAADFIAKPPRGPVVAARVRSQLKIRELMEQLRAQATTDPLTGLANRRRLAEFAEREWTRAQRTGFPMSVVLLDVDCFKLYNDSYGHQMGDVCLQQVAEELRHCVHRPADLVVRYGGEEFAVLLPETDGKGAIAVGERLRAAIESLEIPHQRSSAKPFVTVSCGVGSYDRDSDTWVGEARHLLKQSGRPRPPFAALLEAADRALYAAKDGGRNQVAFERVGSRVPTSLDSSEL